jgi:riboflavin synthase alpha subunit
MVLAAGLFYAFKPKLQNKNTIDSNISETNSKIFNLVIEKGKIVSGESTIKVTEGDNITISVLSDTDEEVHFHGFDKKLELQKNVRADITFTANLTGRFEFELEKSGIELGVIEVMPK